MFIWKLQVIYQNKLEAFILMSVEKELLEDVGFYKILNEVKERFSLMKNI